jgi:RNA-binding protein
MITKVQLKRFRAIGHRLKPVVTIAGNGLSDAVMGELNRALKDHELIKIRINAEDRNDRDTTIEQIRVDSESHIVQRIGNVALFYKQAAKPDPKLSNLLRTDIL